MFHDLLVVPYVAASVALLVYSANCYAIIVLYFRQKHRARLGRARRLLASRTRGVSAASLPVVTTQIPIYNEANVAERAMRAAAAMDYPRQRHEIQVLDDSTDETREIVNRTAADLRVHGHRVVVLRRKDRSGFKAGALAAGLRVAAGELIAVFDADFVPPRNFLRATVPFLAHDDRLGLVQARWGHLNDRDSLLTRAQAIGIDSHFVVEQSARTFNGLLMNFNGTAGIWRRAAIVDAGGWSSDTLTEDLDLSYRAQLAGWQTHFVIDLETPAELPETIAAFKSQQFRWAKGSIQTARKLLPLVWRSERSWWVKVQATFHLTYYVVHPLMLIVALLAAPVQWTAPALSPAARIVAAVMIAVSVGAPILLCVLSQWTLHRDWWKRICSYPALMAIGIGVTASNTRAVLEALIGHESEFVRTPKRGGRAERKRYRVRTPVMPWIELALGTYCAASLFVYVAAQKYALAPFLAVQAAGFFTIGCVGLWEQRGAAARPVRLGWPAAGVGRARTTRRERSSEKPVQPV